MIHRFISLLNSIYSLVANLVFSNGFTSNGNVQFNFGSGILSPSKSHVILGKNVKLSGWIIIEKNGKVRIGDYVSINERTFIKCMNSINIGSYVLISSDVYIQDNNSHSIYPQDRRLEIEGDPVIGGSGNEHLHNPINEPIIIGDDVWIGRSSTILKGVTLGNASIVASGSVVTKSFPEYTIIGGNPAKILKSIPKNI